MASAATVPALLVATMVAAAALVSVAAAMAVVTLMLSCCCCSCWCVCTVDADDQLTVAAHQSRNHNMLRSLTAWWLPLHGLNTHDIDQKHGSSAVAW